MTDWLEVRVLPAPPRSLTQTEISQFIANCPELAGFRVCASSLKRAFELLGPFRGLCLCPAKSRFPTAETGVGRETRFECYVSGMESRASRAALTIQQASELGHACS
jgi:hypothetical protein